MTTLTTNIPFRVDRTRTVPAPRCPKNDWPLMGDIATCRDGVPEALILWRRAERRSALPNKKTR